MKEKTKGMIAAFILIVSIVIVLSSIFYSWIFGEPDGKDLKLGIKQVSVDDDNRTIDSVEYSITAVKEGSRVFWKDVIIKIDGATIWDGRSAKEGWQIIIDDSKLDKNLEISKESFTIISLDPSKLNKNSFVQISIQSGKFFDPKIVWQSLVY